MIKKPAGSYISYFSNLVKENGGINLAQGIPGFQPPAELVCELKDIASKNVHQYPPGIGNFDLLNQLYGHYSQQLQVDRENFLVVQGATEALSLTYIYLAKKLKGKFSVLSFDPAYESYSQLPKIFGQPFVNYPLNEHNCFNSTDLARTVRESNVRVVFISSPGNPYGKVWSRAEVETLVEMAHQHKLYLIFDGVYKDIYFENPPIIPLDYNSPNVFYVNSFSKMLCITGWRVGYLYAHEEHRNELRAIHDYTGLCAPSVLQQALANYLSKNDYGDKFVREFRQNVKGNFDLLSKALVELGFHIPTINGGCFVWARLPQRFPDGFSIAHSLYKATGVATIPGEHFSTNHINWLRFNIARPNDEIAKAASLIEQFMKNT